jgi:transposase
VPGTFHVIKTVREQKNGADGTWTAPERFLIPRAMCGDGLLAQVVVHQFDNHIPLNRQAKRFARRGLSFGTNVLAGWTRMGLEHIQPIVRAIAHQVVADQLLLTNDTHHPADRHRTGGSPSRPAPSRRSAGASSCGGTER